MLCVIVGDFVDCYWLKIGVNSIGLFYLVFSLFEKVGIVFVVGIVFLLIVWFGFVFKGYNVFVVLEGLKYVFVFGFVFVYIVLVVLFYCFLFDCVVYVVVEVEFVECDCVVV